MRDLEGHAHVQSVCVTTGLALRSVITDRRKAASAVPAKLDSQPGLAATAEAVISPHVRGPTSHVQLSYLPPAQPVFWRS